MIKNLIYSILAITLVGTSASISHGGLVTFNLNSPNGSFTGSNNYTQTLTGLVDNGVSFDATLSVVGSDNLTQTGNSNGGLGVADDSSDLVSNGEYLGFSLSFTNVSGGTLVFDGFDQAGFLSFQSGDAGFLSVDNSAATTGDNFFTTTTGGALETFALVSGFHAIARADGSGSNSFRIGEVRANFTGAAAVPEPTTSLMFGTALIGLAFRRRRR